MRSILWLHYTRVFSKFLWCPAKSASPKLVLTLKKLAQGDNPHAATKKQYAFPTSRPHLRGGGRSTPRAPEKKNESTIVVNVLA